MPPSTIRCQTQEPAGSSRGFLVPGGSGQTGMGKAAFRVPCVESLPLGGDSPGREKALTAGKGRGGRAGEAGRVGEGRRSTFRLWASLTDPQQGSERDP